VTLSGSIYFFANSPGVKTPGYHLFVLSGQRRKSTFKRSCTFHSVPHGSRDDISKRSCAFHSLPQRGKRRYFQAILRFHSICPNGAKDGSQGFLTPGSFRPINPDPERVKDVSFQFTKTQTPIPFFKNIPCPRATKVLLNCLIFTKFIPGCHACLIKK
jgi:hypothetical protein